MLLRTSIILILILSCELPGKSQETEKLIDSARAELGHMHYEAAFKYLNSVLEKDSLHPEALYLKAESYLVLGRDKYFSYMEKLKSLAANRYVDILNLKYSLFIGDDSYDELYDQAEKNYPGEAELEYCNWLHELDNGDYEKCKESALQLSKSILFGSFPYLALYFTAWDTDYNDALAYLDTLELMNGEFYESGYRKLLELKRDVEISSGMDDVIELPYEKCGPGMGFYIIDRSGNKIKMELDTGTGYSMMTVHDIAKGKSIYGKDTITIENGIQYNYMDGPVDFHFKLSEFTTPAYNNMPVGYFKGSFQKADGCFSPFVFTQHAIEFDPFNEKVYLRSEANLQEYKKKYDGELTTVPYKVRNGWIYLPCTVNGREVLMMMETGSRDVGFNIFSAKKLGLNVYDDVIRWRGKDYPMKKTDCILEIGNINYDVKGGLISSFVLGNLYYGCGSAGDLGPDFFKNFIFVINPFEKEVILRETH